MKKRDRSRLWPAAAVAAAALALWLVPIPASFIERWYSRGAYVAWQRVATTAANFIPFALFDLILVAAAVFAIIVIVRARRTRSLRYAVVRFLFVVGAAGLWFQLAWGLNYRRVPIAESLALRVTGDDNEPLARFALAAADAAAASADALDRNNRITPARIVADLAPGFTRAQARIGLGTHARPGRPKRSLLNPYFRWAAIDGLTNPFVPETVLVSNLTPAEAYSTAAHEWAHLAGYASEDEASFVGWLACIEAGGGARYNAWIFALMKAAAAVPDADRRALLARAGPIVRGDLAAIRTRFLESSPAVREAASSAYDRFLRANRVEEGIRSYDEVLKLMLASGVRPSR